MSFTSLAFLLVSWPDSAPAQGPFLSAACRENCALSDAVCLVREQSCQVKLDLYNGYMAQLGAGVVLHRLPQLYADLLQPHFSGNLNNVRFGFADRQPAKATTDCSVIYFGSFAPAGFVNNLKDAQLKTDAEFKLLLHELRHFTQCNTGGGRDHYAKRWFGDLNVSLLQQRSIDFVQLHNKMPMEGDAIDNAARILDEIEVIRDQSGKLVRPLAVELLKGTKVIGDMTVWVGTTHELKARVSGGSEPLRFHWSVKAPNHPRAEPISPTVGDETKLQWTPGRVGTYEIGVWVIQTGSELRPALKTIQVKVNRNPLAVGSVSVDRTSPASNLQINLPTFRTLNVEVRRSLADVASVANVCILDGSNQEVYGRKRAEPGSKVSFIVPEGRTVNITVSANRFVGVMRTLTMASADQSITITINRGSGGPTCSVP